MSFTSSRRARVAGVLLAPLFVLVTPSLAMGDDGPSDNEGSTYQDNRSQSGRNSASSDRVQTCSDEDGNVSYERSRRHADDDGVSTRNTNSGDNSANCGSDDGSDDGFDDDYGNDDGNGNGSSDSGSSDSDDNDDSGSGGNDSVISLPVGGISLFGGLIR